MSDELFWQNLAIRRLRTISNLSYEIRSLKDERDELTKQNETKAGFLNLQSHELDSRKREIDELKREIGNKDTLIDHNIKRARNAGENLAAFKKECDRLLEDNKRLHDKVVKLEVAEFDEAFSAEKTELRRENAKLKKENRDLKEKDEISDECLQEADIDLKDLRDKVARLEKLVDYERTGKRMWRDIVMHELGG